MSKEYSPDVVAQSFIKQFYEMLSKNPAELHKFYTDESFFMHSETMQPCAPVTGSENIRKAIGQLRLAGAQVDLSNGSIDAQRSSSTQGVLVVVTGHFTHPRDRNDTEDEPPAQPFMQTFFLASQPTVGSVQQQPSYFVSNSAFRLLQLLNPTSNEPLAVPAATAAKPAELTYKSAPLPGALPVPDEASLKVKSTEHSSTQWARPAAAADTVSSTAAAGTGTQAGDTVASTSTSNVPAGAVEPEPLLKKQQQQPLTSSLSGYDAVESLLEEEEVKPAASASATARAATAPAVAVPAVADTPAAPTPSSPEVDDGVPKSYLDIARKLASLNANVAAPTTATAVAPTSKPTPAPAPAPAPAAAAAAPTAAASTNSGPKLINSNAHSVYVKQLPPQTSQMDLSDLFGSFGTVASVDLAPGRNFAFVRYASSSALRAALAHHDRDPLQMYGHTLRVEERNSASGGGSGGGRGGGNSGNNGGRDHRGRNGGGGGNRGVDRDRRDGGGGGKTGGGGGPRNNGRNGGGGRSGGSTVASTDKSAVRK